MRKKISFLFLLVFAFTSVFSQNQFPTEANSWVNIDGGAFRLIKPETTGGWASGLFYYNTLSEPQTAGIGLFGNGSNLGRIYFAFGENSWISGNGLYILPNGNVGIGTTDPETKLHIKNGVVKSGSDNATHGTLQFAGDYSGDNILNTYGSQYSSGATSIGYAVKQKNGSVGFVSSAGNAAFKKGMFIIDNELEFLNAPGSIAQIDDDVVLTSRFIIKENGNTGIGTTIPVNKLDVNGSIGVAVNINQIGEANQLDINPYKVLRFGRSTNNAEFFVGIYKGNGNNTVNHVFRGIGNSYVCVDNGNFGIGTTNPGNYKLAVEGTIGAREVKVTTDAWADFVFQPAYKLRTLGEVEQYIKANNHLPDVPSESEVKENGVSLGEMNAKLLQKVEELTLYLIEQQKIMDNQSKEIQELKEQIKKINNK